MVSHNSDDVVRHLIRIDGHQMLVQLFIHYARISVYSIYDFARSDQAHQLLQDNKWTLEEFSAYCRSSRPRFSGFTAAFAELYE